MRIEVNIDGTITEHEDAPVIERPIEEILKQQIQEAKTYLTDTAWYVERLNDPSSGKAIPEDVLAKRAEARALINELEVQLGGN